MSLIIEKGSILIYRIFDIAEEVDLQLAGSIVQTGGKELRLKFARPHRNAIVIRNAPVSLSLGETTIRYGTFTQTAQVYAKVWDYGVLSILYQVTIPPGTTWKELIEHTACLSGDMPLDEELDAVALKQSRKLQEILAPALKASHEWTVVEDYVITLLEKISGLEHGRELVEKADVAALLLGESKEALASQSREALLSNVYQYAENDLVVIDWNSAVVLESSGSRDIPDVLEFAVTHLMELRFYDDLLDRRLTELYDAIEHRTTGWFSGSSVKQLAKETNRRFLEISEFIERVDNSLKVVGDFYLATLFRGATRRFRLADWQQSITRKMDLLARVSELLSSEQNASRSHWLELIVILLIAVELISAVFHKV